MIERYTHPKGPDIIPWIWMPSIDSLQDMPYNLLKLCSQTSLPNVLSLGHQGACYNFLLDKILKWRPIYFDFLKICIAFQK